MTSEPESTEPSDDVPAPLSVRHRDALDRFIHLWGDMAAQWGINRTMAQIHALLYAENRPLDTDEIMDRLDVSRGNANTNLRLLVDWRLARKTQRTGSRKDYYVAEGDIWRLTATIIEERRRREILPVERALRGVADSLHAAPSATEDERAFADRIERMVELLELFDGFTTSLLPFLRKQRRNSVIRVVRFARRLRGTGRGSSDDDRTDG
jgi:DNA-binding transcriptional regulator GbsR (MarR family)